MIPYLIYDDYAGLGSKVGFIFGSVMVLALFFVYFCVPECKGKTLEEVDALFNNNVPLRLFGKTDGKALLEAQNGIGRKQEEGPEAHETEQLKRQAVEKQQEV